MMMSYRRVWLSGAMVLAVVLALAVGYLATQKTIMVTVDGRKTAVRTHQRTVSGLLREMGLALLPADILIPPADTPLQDSGALVVRRALPVTLEADGHRRSFYTQADTVSELLREANLTLSPRDQLSVNGRLAPETTSLRLAATGQLATPGAPSASSTLILAASTGVRASLSALHRFVAGEDWLCPTRFNSHLRSLYRRSP